METDNQRLAQEMLMADLLTRLDASSLTVTRAWSVSEDEFAFLIVGESHVDSVIAWVKTAPALKAHLLYLSTPPAWLDDATEVPLIGDPA